MQVFIKTERFKEMNIGFALDEGLASPTEAMTVFFGEKSATCIYSVVVKCVPWRVWAGSA